MTKKELIRPSSCNKKVTQDSIKYVWQRFPIANKCSAERLVLNKLPVIMNGQTGIQTYT